MTDEKPRLEINWVQSAAGALAAVTSAVLLSTVGVAGTLIGAALGSLAATIGSAVYSHYLRATKERVAAAQTVAAVRIGLAQSRVREAPAEAERELERAQEVLEAADPDPAPEGWRVALAGLPWKRIALVSVGVFVAAMAVIVAFELVAGRAVSSYTGGSDADRRTSIPGVGGGAEPSAPPAEPPTDAPTEQPDEGELLVPSESPGETPTESTTPTETPSVEPTETPTPTPTAEPTTPAPTPTPEGQ
ncbi:hypothetical protein [Nocardioides pakistanensis]